MHTGGTAHLGHTADGFLHLLRRHQHQIRQLVNDHHHAGQLFQILSDGGQLVVLLQLLHAVFRESLIALHHLKHGPLQGARRLFRICHHRDQQVGNAVIGGQLHHFRVHHDKAHLVRRRLIQQTDDEGVGAHGFTGAGGTGDQHMGQLFNIADDIPSADVPAQGESRLGRMLHKVTGLDHIPDQHRRHRLVRHLNTHHRDFIRHGGNTNAAGAQRQGDVVLQISDLGELYPLIQGKLIPGDRRPVDHVACLGVHAEAGQGLRKAARIVPQLRPGSHVVLPAIFMQQTHRRVAVFRLAPRHIFGDFRRNRSCLRSYGLGRRLFGQRLLHSRCGSRRRPLRGSIYCGRNRGILRLLRRRRHHHRLHGGDCLGRGLLADRHRSRCGRRMDPRIGKGIALLHHADHRFRSPGLCHHLRRGFLLIGLMPEKAGKASLFRFGCRSIHRIVHRNINPGPGAFCRDGSNGLLRPLRLSDRLLRFRLLLVLGPLPVLLDQGPHGEPQRHHKQHHKQHRKDDY